jgi:hypothetical protein
MMAGWLLLLPQVHFWAAAVAEQCCAAVKADNQRNTEALWQDSPGLRAGQ